MFIRVRESIGKKARVTKGIEEENEAHQRRMITPRNESHGVKWNKEPHEGRYWCAWEGTETTI